jgi:hypothetical protein
MQLTTHFNIIERRMKTCVPAEPTTFYFEFAEKAAKILVGVPANDAYGRCLDWVTLAPYAGTLYTESWRRLCFFHFRSSNPVYSDLPILSEVYSHVLGPATYMYRAKLFCRFLQTLGSSQESRHVEKQVICTYMYACPVLFHY